MTDEFDDLPIDEEADDFQNFNPDKYIRRRQATGRASTGDFDDARDNVDPALPRGRGRRSYRGADNDPNDYDRGRRGRGRGTGRRGRGSVAYDDEMGSSEAADVGTGLFGMFTSLFGESGENLGLLNQILPELKPFGRWIFGLLGCVVVVLCGLACTGVYFIYSLVNTPR